jgi:hypothetical protein
MSSLSFLGNQTSYLSVPNSDALNFRTGDFTIEWQQYQTDTNRFPRIFQMGSYANFINIGVSIETILGTEQSIFYFWRNSVFSNIRVLNSNEYKNVWVHFAISRSSGTTRIFMNGTQIGSIADTNDYNSISELTIGNEETKQTIAAFGGYMTYFSWNKGFAKYTSNFTVPTGFPPILPSTMFMFTAYGFFGTVGSTAVNSNVGGFLSVPSGYDPTPPTPLPTTTTETIQRLFTSLYTNNAQVYYKHNSLASGGVSTVRNSRSKARRT